MAKIFRDKMPIPIPSGAFINKNDGRVFIYLNQSVPRAKSPRKVIGMNAGNGLMTPNQNYRDMYPSKWTEYYGEQQPQRRLQAGLYLMTLTAARSTGIYLPVLRSFGPESGNAIMDYAMFSMLEGENVSMILAESMRDHVLFSREGFSDEKYSELFSNGITEDDIENFKDAWMGVWADKVSEVWVAIDGTNNDNDSRSDLAESGKSKSNNDGPIVPYILALDASTGMPFTWEVGYGSMPDPKLLRRMEARLKAKGIKVRGAIVDRIFCQGDVLQIFEDLGWEWVVKLKSNTLAYKNVCTRENCDEIRWRSPYLLTRKGVFGKMHKSRMFKGWGKEAWVGLYYDAPNGSARSMRLVEKIFDEEESLRGAIKKGGIPSLSGEMSKYLGIENTKDGPVVVRKHDVIQQAYDGKGFSCTASSMEMTAGELEATYRLRDCDEKAFAIVGSELGSGVTRVHVTQSIKSKRAVSFIASVIRWSVMEACQANRYATNLAVKKVDRLYIEMHSGVYYPVHDGSKYQAAVLKSLGLTDKLEDALDSLAAEYNKRGEPGEENPIREIKTMPPGAYRPRGRESAKLNKENAQKAAEALGFGAKGEDGQQTAPAKRGRRKGSKNRSTLEKEAAAAMAAQKGSDTDSGKPQATSGTESPSMPVRKRGRPKGSKNKKTLEREAEEAKREKRRQKYLKKDRKNDPPKEDNA